MAGPYTHCKLAVQSKDRASKVIHLLFVLGAVLCKPRKPELICSKCEAKVLAAIFAVNLTVNNQMICPLQNFPLGDTFEPHTQASFA